MHDFFPMVDVAPAAQGAAFEIPLDAIDVPARLRIVDPDKVRELAASIAEQGVLQPIVVARGAGNRVTLGDGEHRLEACRLLGRSTILAIVRDLTELEREAVEIHANLIRNELNALDRVVFIARLGDIFEAQNPDARHGGDRKSKKWQEKNQFANLANWSAFDKEAAKRTGLSVRSIERARELAAKLGPDAIAALRGSPLADNAAQLKAVAEVAPQEREAVVKALAEGRAANVQRAREAAGFIKRLDPEEAALRAFEASVAKLELSQLRRRLSVLQSIIALREQGERGKAKSRKAEAAK